MAIGFGYAELYACVNAQIALTIAIAAPLALASRRDWKWWQSAMVSALLCFLIIPAYMVIEDALKVGFGFEQMPSDASLNASYWSKLTLAASCALVIVVPVVAWAYKIRKPLESIKTIGLYALASSFWLYPYYLMLTLLPS